MAFNISNESFQTIFYTAEGISGELMQAIVEYLQSHIYIARLHRLFETIRQGDPLSVFGCRRDILDAMAEALNIRKIPFLIISDADGNNGFLVPAERKEEIRTTTEEVLAENAKPCIITSTELLNKYITASRHKNKGLISITGLSAEQLYILEQMAKKSLGAEVIGEDRMADGTYRFSVHGKTAIEKDQKNVNIGLLLLEMEMMTNGPGMEKNIARAQNGNAYAQAITDVLSKQNFVPFYVIDGRQYMKITQDGFEIGSGTVRYGQKLITPHTTYHKAIPDYEEQLISAIGRFQNAICTTDLTEVYALIGKESQYDLTEEDRDRMAGERIVAREINEIVLQKVERENGLNIDGQYATRASHVIEEMGRVMQGAIWGKTPAGYEDAVIESVEITMQKEGLKPAEYQNVVDAIKTVEIVPIAEEIERIDIEAELAKMDHFNDQRDREEIEEEIMI